MNGVRFAEDNVVMKAPPGLPEGSCRDIHAFTDGVCCVTCWAPTPEERAAIAAGGPVWLSVHMGGSMPPVSLHGTTPFIQDPTEERLEEIKDGAPACAGCLRFINGEPIGLCTRWEKPTPSHYSCEQHQPR